MMIPPTHDKSAINYSLPYEQILITCGQNFNTGWKIKLSKIQVFDYFESQPYGENVINISIIQVI